jgi:hypothetical protein
MCVSQAGGFGSSLAGSARARARQCPRMRTSVLDGPWLSCFTDAVFQTSFKDAFWK